MPFTVFLFPLLLLPFLPMLSVSVAVFTGCRYYRCRFYRCRFYRKSQLSVPGTYRQQSGAFVSWQPYERKNWEHTDTWTWTHKQKLNTQTDCQDMQKIDAKLQAK